MGVCLGHQGIFVAFGGEITRNEPVHGKQSNIFHTEDGIFRGVENPLPAARYHSLFCKDETKPECMEIIARTNDGMIMGIKHTRKTYFWSSIPSRICWNITGYEITRKLCGDPCMNTQNNRIQFQDIIKYRRQDLQREMELKPLNILKDEIESHRLSKELKSWFRYSNRC